MFCSCIAAQLGLFFRDQCFKQHERGRFPLRALQTLEDVDHFERCLVTVAVGRK